MLNETFQGEGFFISYNPIANNGGPETAIVVGNGLDAKYYILNGDWRKEYKETIDKGFDAVYSVFMDNRKEHVSFWSN